MSNAFERFEHHGKMVWARSDLKGRFYQYCLCFECGKFNPKLTNVDGNCPIATALYRLCVKHDLVTPVFECPEFETDDR